VIKLRPGRFGIRFLGWESYFLLSKMSLLFLASYSRLTEVPSSEEKRPVREVDHSRQFNTEVKNEWSYTLISAIRLIGIGRDNLLYT
jgi:hypothetical protein